MTSSVAWIGFGFSNSLSRTLVHFCPNGSAGLAQQAGTVDCTLSVFGHATDPEQVILEGARLGMPDGVAVEEAFTSIADYTGMFGIALTLSSNQVRLDQFQSECWIELVATNFSVAERSRSVDFLDGAHAHSMRYIPQMVFPRDGSQKEGFREPGLAVLDSFNSTSVIVVNPHENTRYIQRSFDAASTRDYGTSNKESVLPDISDDAVRSSRLVGVDAAQDRLSVPPYSISEHKLEKSYYVLEQPREGSWGVSNINTVSVTQNDDGCLYFAMYRDTITKRPMSVSAL